MVRVSTCDSCLASSKQEALSSSSTSKLCRNIRSAGYRRGGARLSFLFGRKTVGHNIVRRVFFQNRLPVCLEPGVAVELAACFIPHAENDLRRRAVAR